MKKEIAQGRDAGFFYKDVNPSINTFQYSWQENESKDFSSIRAFLDTQYIYTMIVQECAHPVDFWISKKGLWGSPQNKKYIVRNNCIEFSIDLGRFVCYYGVAQIRKQLARDILEGIFDHSGNCALLLSSKECDLDSQIGCFIQDMASKSIKINYSKLINHFCKEGVNILIPQIYTDDYSLMAEYVIDIFFNKKDVKAALFWKKTNAENTFRLYE